MSDDIEPARAKLRRPLANRSKLLVGLITLQVICAVFFVGDVIADAETFSAQIWHMAPEIAATTGMISALIVEVLVLLAMLRKEAMMERSLGVAAGALGQLMEEYFLQWGLTPSEQDIAAFTIKGFSIAEIAELRGSAEGTVKTHLNAIYRKSGMQGRGQLVSLLIEDLLNRPLVSLSNS